MDVLGDIALPSWDPVTDVTTGSDHTCVLHASRRVGCFGSNSYGQLGLGDADARGDQAVEMGANMPDVDLGIGFAAVQLGAGAYRTCALSDDNRVKCWGDNQFGQLGLGDTAYRGDQPDEMSDDLPSVDLGSGFTPVRIAPGAFHTCALSSAGDVKCWGYNGYGQLGLGDLSDRGDGSNEMAAD
jgi:alpha-tubulin suppressor-like RCC1 family protein